LRTLSGARRANPGRAAIDHLTTLRPGAGRFSWKRIDLRSIGSLEKTLRASPAWQAGYRYFFRVLDTRC
jgi:hypothetical protein